MIHYHGTPITPRKNLLKMEGRHFCVSFADPRDIDVCVKTGQSVMLDNGAFSAFTRGFELNINEFYRWIDPFLCPPHWAVIPDKIGGDVDEQRKMVASWPFSKRLGLPVFHLHLSINYLLELCGDFGAVCLGSSAQYWQVGGDMWCRRMDELFNAMEKTFKTLPWVHGLRMLGQCGNHWPMASADSANVARNHKDYGMCPDCVAQRIDRVQPRTIKWVNRQTQSRLF